MSQPPSARSRILATGTAVPERQVTQDAALALFSSALPLDDAGRRKLRALYRGTRIGARATTCAGEADHPLSRLDAGRPADPATSPSTAARMRVYAKEAPPLAERACRGALASPGAPPPEAITHVIVASCTGFLAPGLDVLLVRALGLREDVGRTLVGFQGCQAGLTALRLADAIGRADEGSVTLVACVELCTLHVQETVTDDDVLAAALFGDGASAAIVGGPAVPSRGRFLEITRCATRLSSDSLDHMTWSVEDHGFGLRLSSYVPRVLGADARPFLAETLGVEAAEIASLAWAVHPGGAAILDALERSLELPADALAISRDVLRRHGNMSSPTIWFVLDEMLRSGVSGDGVALAFGPGLTMEAARWTARSP
jgi:predicted naringenin-chalcone synthase